MTIEIRPAGPAEAEPLCEGNLRLAAESEGKELDRATVAAGVAAALGDTSKARYFVALVDGRVVGMLMVTYEWSDWRCGWVWWLQSVYVWPEFRRRGVFRQLFGAARAQAEAEHAVGLRLYVLQHNHPARRVYEAVGMKVSAYGVYEDELADEPR